MKSAIRAAHVSKKYRRNNEAPAGSYRTLREDLIGLPGRILRAVAETNSLTDFWALSDVSFQIQPGEVLGIIGRNGAGKSTLLKILSRIIRPTSGEIDIHGRVGSLLEVGTGFHAELTGRENIFLSGAILGMRRNEIKKCFEQIVAFAEVESFIDEPVKHYSSGMYARLAFSVATHLSADIVLMDEVLAVGDAEFRRRCSHRVSEMVRDEERAVIVVSHEPALVRKLCSRVLLLKSGRVEYDGLPEEGLRLYHSFSHNTAGLIRDCVTHLSEGFQLDSVQVEGETVRQLVLPANCRLVTVEISGRLAFAARVALEVRLRDREGNTLALCSPGHERGGAEKLSSGKFSITLRVVLPRLLQGRYSLGLYLTDPNVKGWVDLPEAVYLEVEGSTTPLGVLPAGSHSGYMLLDSERTTEPKSAFGE